MDLQTLSRATLPAWAQQNIAAYKARKQFEDYLEKYISEKEIHDAVAFEKLDPLIGNKLIRAMRFGKTKNP